MRDIAASIAAVGALAVGACAAGSDTNGRYSRLLTPTANPSAVIATELAFARMARDVGTWTAFRTYATDDALFPAPARNVQESLKDVPDPAEPVLWGPDAVWSSCDGSYSITTGGAVFPGGRTSRFLTVWQRQRDGKYRWVLDQGFDREDGYAEPEMISAKVAKCPTDRSRERAAVRRGEDWSSGRSDDGTLVWRTDAAPDCSRMATVSITSPQGPEEVFRRAGAAPAAAAGEPAPSCG